MFNFANGRVRVEGNGSVGPHRVDIAQRAM